MIAGLFLLCFGGAIYILSRDPAEREGPADPFWDGLGDT